jgi:hypothetical protein
MKKSYFVLIDTETTQDQLVADFGAIIVDRKGNIVNQCAVLVGGVFTDPVNHPLFFTSDPDGVWSEQGQKKRYENYHRMLDSGSRMIAGVSAINNWLAKASATYQPILTAYNLPFDLHKCGNTGIDLTLFPNNFCLWKAAFTAYAHSKAYRKMVLDLHAFNNPTPYGNMSFKTNAETMARFCLNEPFLEDEPHTALEDLVFYELPILKKLCKAKSNRWLLNEPQGFDWTKVQVKDWFKPA